MLHNCHQSHQKDINVSESRCYLRLLVLARLNTKALCSLLYNIQLETCAPQHIQPLLFNPCLSEYVIYYIVTR